MKVVAPIVALLALVAVGCSEGGMTAAEDDPNPPIQIVLTPESGVDYVYDVTVSLGAGEQGTAQMAGTMTQSYTQVDGGGYDREMALEVEVVEATGAMEFAAPILLSQFNTEGETVTVDSRGQVVGGNPSLVDMVGGSALPEGEVRPGDSWTSVTDAGEATLTFEDYEDLAGNRTARLVVSISAADVETPQGNVEVPEGDIGTIWIDVETGVMVKQSIVATLPQGEISFEMELRS